MKSIVAMGFALLATGQLAHANSTIIAPTEWNFDADGWTIWCVESGESLRVCSATRRYNGAHVNISSSGSHVTVSVSGGCKGMAPAVTRSIKWREIDGVEKVSGIDVRDAAIDSLTSHLATCDRKLPRDATYSIATAAYLVAGLT